MNLRKIWTVPPTEDNDNMCPDIIKISLRYPATDFNQYEVVILQKY